MLKYFNTVFLEILNVPLRTVFTDPVTYILLQFKVLTAVIIQCMCGYISGSVKLNKRSMCANCPKRNRCKSDWNFEGIIEMSAYNEINN